MDHEELDHKLADPFLFRFLRLGKGKKLTMRRVLSSTRPTAALRLLPRHAKKAVTNMATAESTIRAGEEAWSAILLTACSSSPLAWGSQRGRERKHTDIAE